MKVENTYVKLNVEKYGGMILSPWLDRPLSVAGRVFVAGKDGKPEVKLVNLKKDLLIIPNVAIHFNREINNGFAYNPQTDMAPLMGLDQERQTWRKRRFLAAICMCITGIKGASWERTIP